MQTNSIAAAPALLRLREVCRRTAVSRSRLYQMIHDGKFPAAVRIGSNVVAWPEGEVSAWIAERIAERDAKAA